MSAIGALAVARNALAVGVEHDDPLRETVEAMDEAIEAFGGLIQAATGAIRQLYRDAKNVSDLRAIENLAAAITNATGVQP